MATKRKAERIADLRHEIRTKAQKALEDFPSTPTAPSQSSPPSPPAPPSTQPKDEVQVTQLSPSTPQDCELAAALRSQLGLAPSESPTPTL